MVPIWDKKIKFPSLQWFRRKVSGWGEVECTWFQFNVMTWNIVHKPWLILEKKWDSHNSLCMALIQAFQVFYFCLFCRVLVWTFCIPKMYEIKLLQKKLGTIYNINVHWNDHQDWRINILEYKSLALILVTWSYFQWVRVLTLYAKSFHMLI